jgi:hypothetical protein
MLSYDFQRWNTILTVSNLRRTTLFLRKQFSHLSLCKHYSCLNHGIVSIHDDYVKPLTDGRLPSLVLSEPVGGILQ